MTYSELYTVLFLAKFHSDKGLPQAKAEMLQAESLRQKGLRRMAALAALKSLSYSVGVEHKDFRRAAALVPA